MRVLREIEELSLQEAGSQLHLLAAELYPICRSISGDGLRATLAAIQKRIPLQIVEIPTGTAVFDWIVPKEWNIRDAYIRRPGGPRLVDFQACNLHVLNYSAPVHATLPLSELRPHLFTLPDRPDWIPYRTSYYERKWGFCLSHNQMLSLEDGDYEVCIDSSLEDGWLTYGECLLPGLSTNEIVFERELKQLAPNLIFTHYRDDAHQDHRLISEPTWNTFRDHLILEYEIPKYDGDLGQPSVFIPLEMELSRKKVRSIMDTFQSQRDKHWFEATTFFSLMRLRGIECRAAGGHAEAFYCRKLVL